MTSMIVSSILLSLVLSPEPSIENEISFATETEIDFEIWNLPNVCDQIDYTQNGKFSLVPSEFDDREKAKEIAKLVSVEMGADARLLLLWGTRGSNWHPTSLHLMAEDLKYDKQQYKKHLWSQKKFDKFTHILEQSNPNDSKYWKAKDKLFFVNLFKNNEYYSESYVYENREKKTEEILPVFAVKHGTMDINPISFIKTWDRDAPPWIACNDYGLIQYIAVIWHARKFQKKCSGKVENGDSYGVIDSMYARGRCQPPSEDFIKRASRYGIDHTDRAKLGKKWPIDSDRKEIYLHMRNRAIEEGIL